MPERLVIIGGDAAGLSAATNARRRRSAEELEIVAFERGDWISFSACGEPYFVAGIVPEITDLLALPQEEFARHGIEVRKRCEVVAIDTEAQTVRVQDALAGREELVGYDHLVYATGARPRETSIEGAHLRGVYEMHTLDDALAVEAALDPSVRRAVIVGGGFIGIEMAEAFHHRGIETTLVSSSDGVLDAAFDPPMSAGIVEHLQAAGVRVEVNHRVDCLQGTDGRVTSVGCSDREYPADIVLVAAGTVPNVELARAAGIRIGESGGVWVDDRQRTSVPNVWSAGDCAEAAHRLTGQPVNIHLGTYANRQGRVAGLNIGGADVTFPGALGTGITRFASFEIARTGLTEAAARQAGYDPVVADFNSRTGAGYWPDAEPMRVRALADRSTRRLIGAQVYGGTGAGKRIDALAMAIWNEMTADDLVNADLSYAPPFSGVWEPVLVAARQLLDALD